MRASVGQYFGASKGFAGSSRCAGAPLGSRMTTKLFTVDEYVRWSDVDHAGIIFYGAYVRFFEIAETEMFRSAGLSYGEVFDRFDVWLPRVHLECDFNFARWISTLEFRFEFDLRSEADAVAKLGKQKQIGPRHLETVGVAQDPILEGVIFQLRVATDVRPAPQAQEERTVIDTTEV